MTTVIRESVFIGAAICVAACGADDTAAGEPDAATPTSSSSAAMGGGSGAGPAGSGGAVGGAAGSNGGAGGGSAGQDGDAPTSDARGDGDDGGAADAPSVADSGACPTLAANPCWRSYINEYATIATCFTHRNRCDVSGVSGDPSECGQWTDTSKSVCLWADGTELDRMAGLNIVKNPAKTECYRREYGASIITFTFGSRSYVFHTGNATQWVMTCPDGSDSRVPPAEVTACAPPGICCSTMTPPVCEPFPF